MADSAKPTQETTVSPQMEPTVTVGPEPVKSTSANELVENKKKSNTGKIILVIVAVLCLCGLFVLAATYVFANFINRAADAVNSAISNELMNTTQGVLNSTMNGTQNDISNNMSEESNGAFAVGTDIPADFPGDIPIYSGAVASFSSSSVNSEGKKELTVTFTLAGKASDVVSFYKNRMPSAGYTLSEETNIFGNFLGFSNSQREVWVSVLGSDSEQDIILSLISTEK